MLYFNVECPLQGLVLYTFGYSGGPKGGTSPGRQTANRICPLAIFSPKAAV
jgi:hypothetical protein